MRKLLLTTALATAATFASLSATAATFKTFWNHPANAIIGTTDDGKLVFNGRVTPASDCLLDNEYLFACTNDHPQRVDEDSENGGEFEVISE